MRDGILLAGGALALLLLSSRKTAKEPSKPGSDRDWEKALLSEYFPDAPPDLVAMEGGPLDRMKKPIITAQQHMRDKTRYPYISVSGDLQLRGESVPYGARIYFGAYPDLIFRIVDTGGRFRGNTKKIRKPGYEPFDIATDYGTNWGFAGKETVYRLDRSDTLQKRQNVA